MTLSRREGGSGGAVSQELQIVRLENEITQLHALFHTLLSDLGGQVSFAKHDYLEALLDGRRVEVLESRDEVEVLTTAEPGGEG